MWHPHRWIFILKLFLDTSVASTTGNTRVPAVFNPTDYQMFFGRVHVNRDVLLRIQIAFIRNYKGERVADWITAVAPTQHVMPRRQSQITAGPNRNWAMWNRICVFESKLPRYQNKNSEKHVRECASRSTEARHIAIYLYIYIYILWLGEKCLSNRLITPENSQLVLCLIAMNVMLVHHVNCNLSFTVNLPSLPFGWK